jgi:L-aspartate oxidase
MGSLAPRDVVAREIDAELKRSGSRCVFLDMTHLDGAFVVQRFPAIHARCMESASTCAPNPIPVVPAAHYMCGGVVVDNHGRTGIPGLLAIGEVAMSGLHGACRLASNSLLEAVVLASRRRLRGSPTRRPRPPCARRPRGTRAPPSTPTRPSWSPPTGRRCAP